MKKPSLRLYNKATGITLRCGKSVAAFRPDGSEIVSRYWGKRNSVMSQHRILVVEFVAASRNNTECTREFLLSVLNEKTHTKNGKVWSKEKLDERLSTLLAQIKRSFDPYELIEKIETGYRLHSSVKVEFITPQTSPLLFQNSFEDHFAFSF